MSTSTTVSASAEDTHSGDPEFVRLQSLSDAKAAYVKGVFGIYTLEAVLEPLLEPDHRPPVLVAFDEYDLPHIAIREIPSDVEGTIVREGTNITFVEVDGSKRAYRTPREARTRLTPECPNCGAESVKYVEGCVTCICGWTACS